MIFCAGNNITGQEQKRGTPSDVDNRKEAPLSGIVVIDKDAGISSFGVVSRVKNILKIKKAGHTGTLDPFATGVLVVCLGQATRIIPFLEEGIKIYKFTVLFGKETDTWDSTGEIVNEIEPPDVGSKTVESVASELMGDVELPVPRYSAVKMGGKRLYKLARQGIDFELPRRKTTIHRLEVTDYQWPEVTFITTCGKGTYIRSIAKVIGDKLDIPVHVKELRRLQSGAFRLEDAVTLQELKTLVKTGNISYHVVSMNLALKHMPALEINRKDAEFIRKGGAQAVASRLKEQNEIGDGYVRIITDQNDLVAIAEVSQGEKSLKIIRVFSQKN